MMKKPQTSNISQQVKQKMQQSLQNAGSGAVNEAQNMLRTATSQVSGQELTPSVNSHDSSPRLPDHNNFNNMDAYRQQLEHNTNARIAQLKQIIDGEINQAKMKREQEQQAIQQAQAQQMEAENNKKEEQNQGIMATISKTAKKVRGRLGQIGKGKSEKGKAAKG